ncbi:MAG: sulfatase-like hydrolase/transferase, partial [Bacteroidota bacterium]
RQTHPPRKEIMPDFHSIPEWRGAPGGDTYYSFYYGRLELPTDREVYPGSDWYHVEGAIDRILNFPKDKPLCIYLPLGFPHPPYGVEDPYHGLIDRAKIPGRIPAPRDWAGKPSLLKGISARQHLETWTEDRWTELRATYYGMCARVDHQFGMILKALREAGIYDDAAVFFFADHGDFTGDYGLVEKTQNTFEDCLTRVPFLIKLPSWCPVSPRVSEALVELVDFSATVYDIAGIQPGYSYYGRSLAPLVAGETDSHRDAVFCEGGRLHGETHCMERESTSSHPSGLYWPRISLQNAEGPEHTKAVMIRTRAYKYVRRLYEADELYDLRSDPGETRNLIDEPSLRQELASLKERMLTWFMATSDVVPHDADQRR